MKIKKESIEKTILGILTFILICYIAFNLLFLSMFNISEKFLNKNNVVEFINKIDIIAIIKEELGNEVDEFLSIENELKNIGISTEGINEFINSTDVKDFSTNIVSDVFEKVINNNLNNYYIKNTDITNLIENNIDKLQINSTLTESQILDKISSKVPDLVTNINKLIDKLCEKLETSELFTKYQRYIYMSVDVLDIMYSDIVYFLVIFVFISFVALLIFIRKSIYKSLKWLSVSFITPAILLLIFGYILINYISINNILIDNIISIVYKYINIYSLIYALIAFIVIIINIISYFIKRKHQQKNDN